MLPEDTRLMGLKQTPLLLLAQQAMSISVSVLLTSKAHGGITVGPDDTCTFRVALLERSLGPRAQHFMSKHQTLLQISQAHSSRKLA